MCLLVIAVVFAFFIIAVIELPVIYREKKWKELIIFFVIWSSALSLSILQVLDFELPTPVNIIEGVWKK